MGIADSIDIVIVRIASNIVYNNRIVQDQIIGILHFNSSNKGPIMSACKASHIDEIADDVNLGGTIVILGIDAYIRTEIDCGKIVIGNLHIIGRTIHLNRIGSSHSRTASGCADVNLIIQYCNVIGKIEVNTLKVVVLAVLAVEVLAVDVIPLNSCIVAAINNHSIQGRVTAASTIDISGNAIM